jgi:hypothetical protein
MLSVIKIKKLQKMHTSAYKMYWFLNINSSVVLKCISCFNTERDYEYNADETFRMWIFYAHDVITCGGH